MSERLGKFIMHDLYKDAFCFLIGFQLVNRVKDSEFGPQILTHSTGVRASKTKRRKTLKGDSLASY